MGDLNTAKKSNDRHWELRNVWNIEKIETYKNFRPFWQSRLSFAFELLQHFLNDMQGIISSIVATEEDTDNLQSKWGTCESLFRLVSRETWCEREKGHEREKRIHGSRCINNSD